MFDMSDPKVGPIQNLLANGWCKRALARTKTGAYESNVNSPDITQYCIHGAFIKVYGSDFTAHWGKLEEVASKIPAEHRYRILHIESGAPHKVVVYNNHPDTTLDDILKLARELDKVMQK